ncbi:MAG: tetratricopeptide repeat protein [Flavobacteriales bacterium]
MNRLLIFFFAVTVTSINAQDLSMVKELLMEEEIAKAKTEVQSILSEYPESAAAYYWLGSTLAREYSSAQLNPSRDVKPMIDAGISFEKAKFLNQNCLVETDGGRRLKSFSSKVYNLAINAYKDSNVEMAFTYFKMVAMSNDWVNVIDTETLYYTGHCANKLEDSNTAKMYLEKALANKPEDVKIAKELVKANIKLGEQNEAKAVIKNSLTYNPTEQDLWQELMMLSLDMADNEEALSAAQTLSHLDSGNISTKAFLASLYDKNGKKEKAISTYVECVTMDPEHTMATYNLGVLLYNQSVKVLQMSPTPEQKLEANKTLEMSSDYLKQAQKLDPSNSDIKKILSNIDKMK